MRWQSRSEFKEVLSPMLSMEKEEQAGHYWQGSCERFPTKLLQL